MTRAEIETEIQVIKGNWTLPPEAKERQIAIATLALDAERMREALTPSDAAIPASVIEDNRVRAERADAESRAMQIEPLIVLWLIDELRRARAALTKDHHHE